jgi:hypothetical protein
MGLRFETTAGDREDIAIVPGPLQSQENIDGGEASPDQKNILAGLDLGESVRCPGISDIDAGGEKVLLETGQVVRGQMTRCQNDVISVDLASDGEA